MAIIISTLKDDCSEMRLIACQILYNISVSSKFKDKMSGKSGLILEMIAVLYSDESYGDEDKNASFGACGICQRETCIIKLIMIISWQIIFKLFVLNLNKKMW